MTRTILLSITLVSAIIVIIAVLLQAKGSGLGGIFGGEGNIYRTRRGLEKGIFILTIVVGIIFAASAFLNVIIQ
ncbi:preprotein translocase subunit SecG [bacterium CG_4_10_14_0_2_um_filter_33_32]|nr:MAG: preprotein translocase subunit SecG [bacterium CG_4_10_14_0_2_um_filter_33_32]PJA71860.1 MAG: preprotein translocase subunit SecG [bacterium CG_4_9_14_3_um_filter_33_26]